MSRSGIRERTLRGGVWLTAGSGSENVLRALRTIILTRFLAPEAFGVVAIVLAVSQLFEALTEVGIREGIIQNARGGEHRYLNTAQLASLARAFILYFIGWISVPWIAAFYGDPGLIPMLRTALLGLLFNGATSVRVYALQKQMRYIRWVIVRHGGSALGIAVAIGIGMRTHSAWALVIGFVAEAVSRCLLSYLLCPFLPRLEIDRSGLRDLLRYSRGYLGIPIIAYFSQRMDILVLGKLVSAEQLGLYAVVFSFAQLPVRMAAGIINPLLLPAYAEVRADRIAFGRRVLQSTRLMTLAFLPVLAVMAAGSHFFLTLLYGKEYATIPSVLALLCLGIGLRILGWTFGTAYLAGGVPELQRITALLRFGVKAVTILPLTLGFGLNGAALAGVLPHLAALAYNLRTVRRLAEIRLGAYSMAIMPALIVAFGLGLSWVMLSD